MISLGSIESGFESQQLINIASGLSSIEGVLLNGLVLNTFQSPELTKHSFI